MLKRFWIPHPMLANPVGPIRWMAWHVGEWLRHKGNRMQTWALDPKDEIPF